MPDTIVNSFTYKAAFRRGLVLTLKEECNKDQYALGIKEDTYIMGQENVALLITKF